MTPMLRAQKMSLCSLSTTLKHIQSHPAVPTEFKEEPTRQCLPSSKRSRSSCRRRSRSVLARPMTSPNSGSGTRTPEPADFQGSRSTAGRMSHRTGAFLGRGGGSARARAGAFLGRGAGQRGPGQARSWGGVRSGAFLGRGQVSEGQDRRVPGGGGGAGQRGSG